MVEPAEASNDRSPMKLTPLLLLGLSLAACGSASESPTDAPVESAPSSTSDARPEPETDDEGPRCVARWDDLARQGRAFGEGPLEQHRERMLGRARGATTLFLRPPAKTPTSTPEAASARAWFDKQLPGTRVVRLVSRHKTRKALLREVLLRDGYAYAEEPNDAFELEAKVTLPELFDDEPLVITRGSEEHRLRFQKTRWTKEYVYDGGPHEGKKAALMFADHVRVAEATGLTPETTLHRDLLGVAWAHGIERMQIERITDGALLARVTVGPSTVRAVLESAGAKLSLGCVAEDAETRRRFARSLEEAQPRALADRAIRDAVSAQTDELLPFDRPRFEKGPDKDGQLRGSWLAAYLRGSSTFEAEGGTYPVFLPDGRPSPPQVCVDFVLDSYERAGGTWFTPRDTAPKRQVGHLDFDQFKIQNRRGVLGFGAFAESRKDLFEFRRFQGVERTPFAQRDRFFRFIADNPHEFRPGDILAIHGLKRDERIHQHAILLEFVDPITGFPSGLADQMKAPRRRSWEGIMAEAPKRSLLYRARPTAALRSPLEIAASSGDPVKLASR
jgi:hypothetical protein